MKSYKTKYAFKRNLPSFCILWHFKQLTNYIKKIDNKVELKQEIEDGYNIIEAAMPCVVTVQKPNYEPRYPTIKTKMAARKKPIDELSNDEKIESSIEVIKIIFAGARTISRFP